MKKLKALLLFSCSVYKISFSQNLKTDTLSIIFNQKGCFGWQNQNLSVLKNNASITLYFNSSFNKNKIDSVINFNNDTNFYTFSISPEKLIKYIDFKNNVSSLKKDMFHKHSTITYTIIENGEKQVIKTNNAEIDFYSLLKSITGLY